MWRVLADDGGVGLAAPQIGVSRRVVVVRDPSRPRGRQRIDLVNPGCRRDLRKVGAFEEGCLSFPGLYTMVQRPQGVELSYHDCQGQPQLLRDEELWPGSSSTRWTTWTGCCSSTTCQPGGVCCWGPGCC